jgi:pyruvate ferredoxin oxidoreductase gamma subunit
VAFCRFDERPIRVREPIATPDALIVGDPTLLHQVAVFDGLKAKAGCCSTARAAPTSSG